MFGFKTLRRIFLSVLAVAGVALIAGCAHDPSAPLIPYACDSGARLQVRYPDADTAIVHYPPRVYEMMRVRAASGARYRDAELQWWTKGSGPSASATLFTRGNDGGPGDIAERCVEVERED